MGWSCCAFSTTLSATWTGEFGEFVARRRVEVAKRYQQDAYQVWDGCLRGKGVDPRGPADNEPEQ